MMYLWELVVTGMAVGALYGLVAMGFAIIYRTSRVVNFAQGEVMMLIAYLTYSVAVKYDLNLLASLLAVLVFGVIVGALIERFVIRPMLGQPIFSIVMMTIAMATVIRSMIGLVWDAYTHAFPNSMAADTWMLLGVPVLPAQVVLFALFLLIVTGIWAFFRFNVIGIAMRATAVDSTAALLMGVSVRRLYRAAWIISACMAGLAGVLFANIYHIGTDIGHIGIRAFPATILGGLDSVLGSALGGLIVGVVENLAGGYIGSGYKEVAGFVVILLILMIRPYGLFGEPEIERV